MELGEFYVFGYNRFEQILQRSDMRILMTPVKFDISLMKHANCSSTISPTRQRANKCHVRGNSGTTFPRETAYNSGVQGTPPDVVAVNEGHRHSGSEDDSRNSSNKHTGQIQMRWNASIFSSGFKLGCVNGEAGKFIDLSEYLGDIVSSPPRKLCLHEDKLYCISDFGDCFVQECTDDTAMKVDKVLLECSSSSNEVSQAEGRHTTKKEGGSKMEGGCESQREDFPTSAVVNLQDLNEASPDKKTREHSFAGFTNISAGDSHVLATIGTENRPGKIRHEDGAYIFHPFHQPVEVQDIACGKEHALLLTTQGLVYSYGMGSRGQLGHGHIGREDEPKLLEAIACVPMVTVSAGGWHSACVSAIGDMYIWGWNESGQLGLPSDPDNTGLCRTQDDNSRTACQVTFQMVPAILDLPGGVNVLKVSCGSRHTAAVTYDKRLYTWGWGKYGQLGHGDVQSREAPKLVDFFHQNRLDVLDVTCGDWSTAVYTSQSPELMPRGMFRPSEVT